MNIFCIATVVSIGCSGRTCLGHSVMKNVRKPNLKGSSASKTTGLDPLLALLICLVLVSYKGWVWSLSSQKNWKKNLKMKIPSLQLLYIWAHLFCDILPRCNNSCTHQGENKQSLWVATNNTMGAKREWYWCFFPSVALIEKGGNTHYQFKDDIQDIKGDKKVNLSNLNSVYIIHMLCMFDKRMKVFEDMGLVIDNWSNFHPTFEKAVRWCFFRQ